MKSVGGSILNSMCVAAENLPPNQVAYFGVVGCDANSSFVRDHLKEKGVRFLEGKNASICDTGTCVVLINCSHRSMITDLAAGKFITPAHLRNSEVARCLLRSFCVYFTGFLIPDSWDAVLHLLEKSSNKLLVYNLGAPAISLNFPARSQEVLEAADVVVGDMCEFLALAGLPEDCSEDDLVAGLKAIHAKMRISTALKTFQEEAAVASDVQTPILLVTHGPRKTRVIFGHPTEATLYEDKPQFLAPHQLLNTSGAGDAFVGGFLSALVQNRPLKECIEKAHLCAHDYISQTSAKFQKLIDKAGVFDDLS